MRVRVGAGVRVRVVGVGVRGGGRGGVRICQGWDGAGGQDGEGRGRTAVDEGRVEASCGWGGIG